MSAWSLRFGLQALPTGNRSSCRRQRTLDSPSASARSLWTQVIFRNEVTSEFLYYTVSFKVIPSGVIKTIEMVTPIRQSVSASIKLENPLPYSVTFSTECRVPDVSLPSQFVVPANSEVRPCRARVPGIRMQALSWARPRGRSAGPTAVPTSPLLPKSAQKPGRIELRRRRVEGPGLSQEPLSLLGVCVPWSNLKYFSCFS